MRMILAAALTAICASTALADDERGRLIVESETGAVFGDLDCMIESHQTSAPRFSVDPFDYLEATVRVTHTCVTRRGREYTMYGYDTVPFLTLDFDWRDQAWYFGDVLIATRVDGWRLVMNPDLDYLVWTDGQESHTSFRVEVREKP